MSYVKAKNKIDVYALDLKKLGADKEGYLGLFLSKGLIKPVRTLLKGEIFSKPYVKEFTDNYGNTWLRLQGYTTGIVPFVKVSGADDYELTGNVLTEAEQKKIDTDRDNSFINKAMKTGANVLKFGLVIGAAALLFYFSKAK